MVEYRRNKGQGIHINLQVCVCFFRNASWPMKPKGSNIEHPTASPQLSSHQRLKKRQEAKRQCG